ncbi:Uncharacterized protein dnm_036180 [Desulfonema magnum]|uniref:Uncharacterized protein n=1 Tax=Desulfonema magnum TaxID=45655 RepID=A0A975GNB0_9BACT|nr:Uncharacterized protein dnm_036180 [Desulfonema magnum]
MNSPPCQYVPKNFNSSILLNRNPVSHLNDVYVLILFFFTPVTIWKNEIFANFTKNIFPLVDWGINVVYEFYLWVCFYGCQERVLS